MTARAVVVTDSTACLPPALAQARGVFVVPLQVVIGSHVYDEGSEGARPSQVAAALREFVPVSTSRPSPAAMGEVYEALVAEGAEKIVAVHLSSEMSGTYESAQLAARDASVPVITVDSRHVGAATGFAALAAADALAAGADVEAAARAARKSASQAKSYFYVDTLEYLRRGGRIGAGAAFLGGALSVKPLLEIRDGRVASLEKVRTSAKALARLEELLVRAAGDSQVDLCISHLASPERAETLAARLAERLTENLSGREVTCLEIGGVLGAHVGPGMVSGSLAVRS
ncbi:DegV family protein [Nocardioides gilvus]|uniref:DegV family protein n=1 Tax=Nocardioides gilvus TaxID=1735589 RepID=UPI000D74A365|nr:DegV family protein [Nocardioides gilvus]